jgi:16S rRNA (cytidine1402-2'-O)-methyltransferase
MSKSLYICPSPIGNLEDMTLRVLRILQEVDFIACEDTRQSRKLLNHYEIKKELLSYHEHNKQEAAEKIITRLKSGQKAALLSDAGMPGINDPGRDLILRCQEEEIDYTVLPGPSAFTTALVYSGLDSQRFIFAGFFPRDKKERNEDLAWLDQEEKTVIYYESPHRIKKTLEVLAQKMPERQLALVREISKIYEEMLKGKAADIYNQARERSLKGEMVLIIEGQEKKEKEKHSQEELEALFHKLMEEGYSKKDALAKLVEVSGHSKNDIYKKFMIK